MKTREQLISEIVENFDWERTHKAMRLLEWKWASAITEDGVPTIGNLMVTAIRLLQDAYDGAMKEKKTYYACTGGFEAIAHVEDGEFYELELQFVLASWDAQVDEQN
jgi:hypothetical protein